MFKFGYQPFSILTVVAVISLLGPRDVLAQPPGSSVQVVTTAQPNVGIFSPGDPMTLSVIVNRTNTMAPDQVDVTIRTFADVKVNEKVIAVPANSANPFTQTIDVSGLPPGYYSVSAVLASNGNGLPGLGTRPAGMSTFGILPSIQALPLASPDASRFGIQGGAFLSGNGDQYEPLLGMIGAKWIYVRQRWADLEPDHPGEFQGLVTPTSQPFKFEGQDQLAVMVDCSTAPKWAFNVGHSSDPTGMDQAPDDANSYSAFLTKVASEQAALRANGTFSQKNGYYQVTWEPDWHFKGSDSALVAQYQTAYQALHAGDPQAVVIGPTFGVLPTSVPRLQGLFQMGLGKYLDGISTHAYFNMNADRMPSDRMAAPETGGLSTSMRALRTMVREYLPPGAKIYETELGMGYPAGSVVDSKLLRQQADDYIRGNIICLGDGADVDGLFYTADYSTDGFGLAFNLDLDKHKYGTDSISPKPVLMATATMTRILEGTQTLGRVTIVAPGVYVYAFRRGQSIVLAAWAYPKYTTINLNLNCPTATIVNMVGVAQPVVLNNGTLRLPLGPDPKYVMDLPLTASLNTSKYQSVSSTQSYSPVATPVRALQESWGGGPNHGH